MTSHSRSRMGPVLAFCLAAAACGAPAPAPPDGQGPALVPSYSESTGRLEQLASDRSGDGRMDTWAYMDGRLLHRIEMDRNGDGVVDRVEHYEVPPGADPSAPFRGAVIRLAEEFERPDGPVLRREHYERGELVRVEEDTDADGRIDKWEHHEGGVLVRMELDLTGDGRPDQRLRYGLRGAVEGVENIGAGGTP